MEYEELVSKLGESNFDFSIIKRKYLRNVKSNLKKIQNYVDDALFCYFKESPIFLLLDKNYSLIILFLEKKSIRTLKYPTLISFIEDMEGWNAKVNVNDKEYSFNSRDNVGLAQLFFENLKDNDSETINDGINHIKPVDLHDLTVSNILERLPELSVIDLLRWRYSISKDNERSTQDHQILMTAITETIRKKKETRK